MGIILDRASAATVRISKLEQEAEELRVARAADLALLTKGEAEDETDRMTAGAIGEVLGISRQNVQKAVRELGPDSPRGRAHARRAAAKSA
jgi:hypothetical protein